MSSLGGGGLDIARGEGGGAREEVGQMGEIENGGVTFDAESSDVVCSGRHFRGGECAQPYARFLAWLPNFGHPLPPISHANPAIHWVLLRLSNSFYLVGFCVLGFG